MALFGRPTERDERRAEAYRDWLRQRNPLAIASVVLGVFSLIEFGALLIFGIAGIVLGMLALVQLRRTRAAAPQPVTNPPAPVLLYADKGLPDEIDGRRYVSNEAPALKTEGHRLAWTGIALSVLSLVVAAVIYTHPWSHWRL